MAKTRVLPIILAAMLSFCANTAAFPATAYAAEPALEAEIGETEEKFEDEDQPEVVGQPETADQPIEVSLTADLLETADQQETADHPIEVAGTTEQSEAADREEEASESAAQETTAAEDQPEAAAQQAADTEDQSVTAEQAETVNNAPVADAPATDAYAPAADSNALATANASADAPASSSEEEHHLAFASDYHSTEGSIHSAMEGMPEDVEYVSLIGDMVGDRGGDHPEYDSREILDLVREVFPELDNESVSIVWATHDLSVNDEGTGIVKCMDGVSEPIHTGENKDGSPAYYIYGIGHYDMANGNELSAGAAAAFKEWVNGIDHTVPVIVLCHVPIQASRGDNNGASYWNEALNYAATGAEGITTTDTAADIIRNVLFLHGHNHTNDQAEYYFGTGTQMSVQADHSMDLPTALPTDPNTEVPRPRPPRIVDGVPSDIYYTSLTAGYLKTSGNATLVTVADGALILTKYHGDQTVDLGIDGNTKEPVSDSITIAAKRHIEGESIKENATPSGCDFGGTYEVAVYCTICGRELHRTNVATEAAGHRWGKWTVIREATETAEGREDRTCSVCGKKETRAIPVTSPERFEDPEKPGESGSSEESGRPSSAAKPGKPRAAEKSEATKASGTAASPKTADQSQWILWMTGMELAVISLAAAVIARRNEERG